MYAIDHLRLHNLELAYKKISLLVVLEMGWKWVFYGFFFLLTVGESAAGSGKIWYLELATGTTSLYSWTIASSSIFVLTALVLSLCLIFEHLAAYNQPEVCSSHHVLFFMVFWIAHLSPKKKYVLFPSHITPARGGGGGELYVLFLLLC